MSATAAPAQAQTASTAQPVAGFTKIALDAPAPPTVRVYNTNVPSAPAPSAVAAVVDDEPELTDPRASAFRGSGNDDPTRPLTERWRAAVEAVRVVSTRHGASLAHGRVLWIRPGEVSIAYLKSAEFHKTMVTGGGRTTVEKALTEHFGRPTKLTIETSTEVAQSAAPSLAEEENTQRQVREKGADVKVRTNPAVLATLKILGGEIEHISVLEAERPAAAAAAAPSAEDPAAD